MSKNLKIKIKKCAFHKKKKFSLRHIVGVNGIWINFKKIEIIRDWFILKIVKEIQKFLKFVNFNWHFIEKYSHKVEFLMWFTQQNKHFYWGPEQQQTFNISKGACTTQPILWLYNPKKRCWIEIDASDLAIRTCLTQKYENKWHPVMYFSQKIFPAKQNYGIRNKKLLAIITSLKK